MTNMIVFHPAGTPVEALAEPPRILVEARRTAREHPLSEQGGCATCDTAKPCTPGVAARHTLRLFSLGR